MKEPSLKKNFLMNNIYQILVILIPFISSPYVARVLGAGGVGIYSYTLSIQTYFSMFAALGTVSYGAREISRNRDDVEKRSLIFWEIELVTICTTAVALLLWIAWIGISTDYRVYYIILSINLLAVATDISWFYTGLECFQHIITKNSFFKIAGLISIFLLVQDKDDVGMYIGIMALTTLLANLSMWVGISKYITTINWRQIRLRSHFKETIIYFIPTIATSVYTVLDKTLIGAITGDVKENGYYEQANKIINMAKILSFNSLNGVLGVRISYLFSENKIQDIKCKIHQSIEYIMFMGIGFCFGIIGIADTFVPLFFGQGYDETIVVLRMMSPLVIIIGISNCLGSQYYTPAGLRKQSALYLIYGSIANLIFNVLFIPALQGRGAVIGSVIAECIISGLYLKNCSGFLTLKNIIQAAWKKIVSALVMLVVILLIEQCSCPESIQLLLQIFFGVMTYIAVLLLLKDSVKQYMQSVVKRFVK